MSDPKDCISLVGITAYGKHGVYDFEREEGQTFTADVDVYTNTRTAASTDNLENTIDYSVLAEDIRSILAGPPSNLIEQVAEHVARAALETGAVATRVCIHKPDAPIEAKAKDVTVTIWRGAEAAQVVSDLQAAHSGELPNGVKAAPVPDLDEAAASLPTSGQTALDIPATRTAVLALGANLADPIVTLRRAVADLDKVEGITVRQVSPLVRSAAVLEKDQQGQPDYLDAVLQVETSLAPLELLHECNRIEDAHGRIRTEHWGPRTLDIDIITIEGVHSQTEELTLPHPRARERAFVLVPWARMDPSAKLGTEAISDLAEVAPDRAGIKRTWENWLDVVEAAREDGEPAPFTGTLPLPSWEAVVRGNQTIRVVDDDGGFSPVGAIPKIPQPAPKKRGVFGRMWDFLRREPTPSPEPKDER